MVEMPVRLRLDPWLAKNGWTRGGVNGSIPGSCPGGASSTLALPTLYRRLLYLKTLPMRFIDTKFNNGSSWLFGFGFVSFYLFHSQFNPDWPFVRFGFFNRRRFGALIFKPGSFTYRPWVSELAKTYPTPRTTFGFSPSPLRGVDPSWIPNRTRMLNLLFQVIPPLNLPKPVDFFIFSNRLADYTGTWFGGITPVFGSYCSFFPSWAVGFVENQFNQSNPAICLPNKNL